MNPDPGYACISSCPAWPSDLVNYPGCSIGNIGCICSKVDVNAILKCCANDVNGQTYVKFFFGGFCGNSGMVTYSSFGPSATATPSSNLFGGASASVAAFTPTAVSNSGSTTNSGSSGSSSSSSSDHSSSLSTATIAGIAIGGAAAGALVIAALAFLCFRARRRRPQQLVMPPQGPYPPASFSTLPPPQQPGYVVASPQATSVAPTLVTAPSSTVTPLNPQNLNQHLASQEWAGLQRPVPQKQTANQSVVEEVLPDGPSDGRTEWSGYGSGTGSGSRSRQYGDGVSLVSEIRPQDAVGEPGRGPRYGSAALRPPASVNGGSRVFSEDPRTAIYPASESVWPTRV